ncbi:SPOR domain-containing protein [Sphaerotilus sp.]|uniref:SPOR domain-containing protein n=1 Tax=Sphaerotilus sp. TaxID=2093942 RepID=UPI002ACD4655|nr:SPOR domain-containing protein [Sphaerotilus sp.]MDZ7856754.1 SPOR domain-containing protein [Sphaerotilus sp.]
MASNGKTQRGGFGAGVGVGLLVGLVLALGVALYVTKAPIPFMDKVPQRTAEQDAAEIEKNRNWDPNSPLHSKNPVKPVPSTTARTDGAAAQDAVASAPARAASAAVRAPVAAAGASGASSAASASAKPGADAFVYFVQVGAYASGDDAEQQRAKLAMGGLKARITEREQSGRLMYRVRLGPFDTRDDAERMRDQTTASGYGEAALVRVPR